MGSDYYLNPPPPEGPAFKERVKDVLGIPESNNLTDEAVLTILRTMVAFAEGDRVSFNAYMAQIALEADVRVANASLKRCAATLQRIGEQAQDAADQIRESST